MGKGIMAFGDRKKNQKLLWMSGPLPCGALTTRCAAILTHLGVTASSRLMSTFFPISNPIVARL